MKTCPVCLDTFADETAFCLNDGTRLTAVAAQADGQLVAGLARHFRIIRRLGKGGMGTVFLAQQIGVGNRPVAIKVLNRKFLDDPDFLMRFQNEAASTGRIHHPNVVTIHESAQGDDGTPYIAMEYLEGESLREFIHRSGPLSVPQTAEILAQTARGLNAAHKLGIIHRDLKPDNIFLTHGDEDELIVKVVDFGIAKLRESATHTMTGMVLGTPAYMSSEQAYGMSSDELDARSDIYSLGVVVYEMLTGRLPFDSDTPNGFLRKHIHESPPPFRMIAPDIDIPSDVENVVLKALRKKRQERYSSALDFARAFVSAAPTAPATEGGQPLATTVMAEADAEMDFDTPLTLSDTVPADLKKTVPASHPSRLRELDSDTRRQRGEPLVKPDDRPKRDERPKPPVPSQPLGIIMAIVAIVATVVIAGGVWHYWPSPTSPVVKGDISSSGDVNPPAPDPSDDNNPIVGCYRWFNGGGVWIRSDHTVIGGPFKGKWQSLSAPPRTYLVTWPQAGVSTVNIAPDQQSLAGGNQYGGKDVAKRVAGSAGLVGTWNWFNMVGSQVTIKSDGTYSAVSPNASWQGTWKTINPFTGTYQLTGSDLPTDRLSLSDDSSQLSGADQYGIAISGTRTGTCYGN